MTHSSIIRQILAYACLAAVTALVLLMSWPRLSASLQFLPVQQAQRQLYGPAPEQDLPALLSRTERAIDTHMDYSYFASLSLLHYLQGVQADAPLYQRRSSLDQSLQAARASLQGAPLQPDLWLRMAQAGIQVFLPAEELAAFFRMAIWSGRVEPTHLIVRLQIGFALLGQLDEESRSLLRDQVLLAWNLKQREFLTAVRKGQLNRGRVVALMAESHPDVVREMETILGPVTL